MKTLHLLISGRVQGVGFRDWLAREATWLNLSGWVRNKGTDMVEAVISGTDEATALCLEKCRRGPALAVVQDIAVTQEAAPPSEPGFARRSSTAAER